MTSSRWWPFTIVLLSAGAACSRSQGDKANDSSAAAPAGSSASSAASSSAATTPAPASSSPDSSTAKAPPPPPARPDSSAPTATPRPMPSETVLIGKVVAGGLAATPTTSLQIEGGKPTTLVGALEPELRRLGGAMVSVAGAPGAGTPNATFTVSRYEIVSIDGVKPLVGLVTARQGATWLAMAADTVKLLTAPAELTSKPGAKVWVIGRRNGREVTTQTYGIIREP
jgi:hypothetical protein